jgi:hypothetical protein
LIFTDHILLRFVQRVIGIPEKQQALKFIEQNKYEVYYKLLKLINESELLHENFSPTGSGKTYNYRLIGDTLIVISSNGHVAVTLYDIAIDLNEKENSETIRDYTKKIKQNYGESQRRDAKRDKINKESQKLEFLVDYTEKELDKLKEQLEEQIMIGRENYQEAKRLKHENRELMTKIMYGFKDLH